LGVLETHVRNIERAYMMAFQRALTRLEEYERRRQEAWERLREALRSLDLEAEKERIRKIMSEIQGAERP
jgi:outer membrane protein assembly factor BamD (BamD/ComL family)